MHRMTRTPLRLPSFGLAIMLGTLAFSAGCKRGPVTYSVTLDTAWAPRSAPFRVTFRGREVPLTPSNDGRELTGTFTASGEEWLSEDMAALVMEVGTPCGPLTWRYLEEPAPGLTSDKLRPLEKQFSKPEQAPSAPVALSFSSKPTLSKVLVHVDRREAESVEVTLGKQPLPAGKGIPAPSYSKPDPDRVGDLFEVAEPTCAEGKVVTVGGQRAGEVTSEGAHTHAVIDAKGGHCYKRIESSYSTSLAATALPFQRPKASLVKGARVFAFGDGPPDYSTHGLFDSCGSVISGRMSCTDVRPAACDEAL